MILSTRRMIIFSIFSVILGVAAIWGLETGIPTEAPETPETEGAGVMVETSHFPLKLTMILNKTTFEVGEPVNMTFYLENIGNETLTMVFSDGHDRFSFNVLDENDSLIYEPHWVYPMVYTPIDVPPSLATITTQTWWQKTNIDDGAQQVKPGKYKIVGLFISGTLDFTIETPPITITIAPSTETSNDEVISETVFNETFKLSMLLDKTTYAIGEPVKITLTLTNVREEDITIVFLTRPTPNPYWFRFVYDENDQIVFSHKYALMIPALEEVTLQPAEFIQGKYTWNQTDANGQQVPPGIYYLTAAVGFMYNGEEVPLETRIKICIEP